ASNVPMACLRRPGREAERWWLICRSPSAWTRCRRHSRTSTRTMPHLWCVLRVCCSGPAATTRPFATIASLPHPAARRHNDTFPEIPRIEQRSEEHDGPGDERGGDVDECKDGEQAVDREDVKGDAAARGDDFGAGQCDQFAVRVHQPREQRITFGSDAER